MSEDRKNKGAYDVRQRRDGARGLTQAGHRKPILRCQKVCQTDEVVISTFKASLNTQLHRHVESPLDNWALGNIGSRVQKQLPVRAGTGTFGDLP